MKVTLKNSRFQIVLEVLSLLILISTIALLIIRWKDLPDQIPGHYNLAGEIDRWGNKNELIVIPVFSIMLYLLLTVITFFPSIWNMPVSVTDKNKEKVYGCVKSMLLVMKVEIMALFFWINYNSMSAKAMTPLFLPILLITVFGTMIYYLVKTVKLSKDV